MKASDSPIKPSLLTAHGVALECGASIPTIWRWHQTDPSFPRSIKLSPGCTRWSRVEIENWIAARAAASRPAQVCEVPA